MGSKDFRHGVGGLPGPNDHGERSTRKTENEGYIFQILENSSDDGAPLYRETKMNQISIEGPNGKKYSSNSVQYYKTDYGRTRENEYDEVVGFDPETMTAQVQNGQQEIIEVFCSEE